MIKAQLEPNPAFTKRLASRARNLATAHATNRLLTRRNDPRRWRLASLLWPSFREDN